MLRTLLLCLLLAACDRGSDAKVEASATATSCNGEVQTREATPDEIAHLKEQTELREDIDKRYPPEPAPFSASTERVVRILDDGTIELGNGARLIMDGVLCTPQGIEALRRMIIDPDTMIVITRRAAGTPTPADIWTATKLEGFTSRSYSNITETALTSGWCTALPSQTNPWNERYMALMSEFGLLRERQEKARANKALQATSSPCGLGRA